MTLEQENPAIGDPTPPEWPALGDRSCLSDHVVRATDRLIDAAKTADWPTVTRLLDADGRLSPSSWRPGGRGFTLLHHAAWHGAEPTVIDALLARGAWRAVRDDAGETPADVARRRGHTRLSSLLEPPVDASVADGAADVDRHQVDMHLARLIESRIRPHLDVVYRPPQTAVLDEGPGRRMWAPVPGMYGGFSVRQAEGHLYVQSWSRVACGSGQTHVVTQHGYLLVDKGFV